jgi:hypothetical protein
MNTQLLTAAIKRQYDYSLTMLHEMIIGCPVELWTEIIGSFPFWQQLYHALYWTDYNIQENCGGEKIFSWKTEKNITHELDEEKTVFPEYLTKDELNMYLKAFIEKKDKFFIGMNDSALLEPIPYRRDGCTYLDIITNQIRHIMYHVGHCDCILRERGYPAIAWISIFGRMERKSI